LNVLYSIAAGAYYTGDITARALDADGVLAMDSAHWCPNATPTTLDLYELAHILPRAEAFALPPIQAVQR